MEICTQGNAGAIGINGVVAYNQQNLWLGSTKFDGALSV